MTTAYQRLAQLLLVRQAQPFAWGERDCASLAFDAVLAKTGRDLFADLRGAYCSAAGALRELQRLNGLAALCDARLGPRVPLDRVQDGDIAWLRPDACTGVAREHGALGVAWSGCVVAQGSAGINVLQADQAACWWRAE